MPTGLRAQSRHKSFKIMPSNSNLGRGESHRMLLPRGDSVATSINRMGTAGILLALATCCGAPEASAQLYLNFGGAPAQGNASIGTGNLGIGGAGSATAVQGLNEPAIGSNRGISLPLLDQQAGKPLGVNGNATGTAQGSLSSAGDHSPIDSVTNTLMGPVGNIVTRSPNPAAKPASKRKQTDNAAVGAVPAAR
jgi:hypothetical protein